MALAPIILIPARLGSTRLAQKMLCLIQGKPLISHVVLRAQEANIGPVYVACDAPEIATIVEKEGVKAILTNPNLPSGSDRIYEALKQIDPQGHFDTVINLQGDLPNISVALIQASLSPLRRPEYDVATLAAVIKNSKELENPNIVKIALSAREKDIYEALYFSRCPIPHGSGPHYHHIGVYAYRRKVLEAFVTLDPSPLEKQERLEQLRLLENQFRFGVSLVDEIPLSIDTATDLERARKILC